MKPKYIFPLVLFFCSCEPSVEKKIVFTKERISRLEEKGRVLEKQRNDSVNHINSIYHFVMDLSLLQLKNSMNDSKKFKLTEKNHMLVQDSIFRWSLRINPSEYFKPKIDSINDLIQKEKSELDKLLNLK